MCVTKLTDTTSSGTGELSRCWEYHLARCNLSSWMCCKIWSRMTDTKWRQGHWDRGSSRGRQAGKHKISKKAGYEKKNRIMKREEGTLGGKIDPQMGPVNSSWVTVLWPKCFISSVPPPCWVLGTTLRTWPNPARQGSLLSLCFCSSLWGPQWLITST